MYKRDLKDRKEGIRQKIQKKKKEREKKPCIFVYFSPLATKIEPTF